MPRINENLIYWSRDLYCIVQFLSNIDHTNEQSEHASQCTDVLFDSAKTEPWGGFGGTEFGSRKIKNMTNYALPLVILIWQRMLLEQF
jgi:hypothetical protein